MERRTFLRAGLAIGAAGAAGSYGLLPEIAQAIPSEADGVLRLNSNENPLGVAPVGRRAIIEAIEEANRYPRERRGELVAALAKRHGVEPANVVLGNGSTEVLQMAVQAYATPDARLVLANPTYEDVPWYAQPFTFQLEKVPLDGRFAHDLGRMRQQAESGIQRALVYLCNPNNPTGTLTPSSEIDAWIESARDDVYFLVDEAYYEYCEDPAYWSCIKWIGDRPNVIVSRSFSKIYGMAGMRLGYAVAHRDTADRLREFIGRNNANQLALAAAIASLADTELIQRSRQANSQGKRILHDCLAELDLEYLPSHTNFVMHRIPGDLEVYQERMAEAGARVGRKFPPMLEYNRLSIGLPEEMERFTDILRGFRKKGWV
jgi:histidinol-phosphate aminotransferase